MTGVSPAQRSGALKWFSSDKGFGFIIPEEGGPDVFLHSRIVRASGINPADLTEGVKLKYEPGQGPKGIQAIKIIRG